jgi:organic radical activating enzyme
MSCLYCGPYFSSVWETELRKYGSLKVGDSIKRNDDNYGKNYDQLKQQLWLWLDKNYQHIRNIQILGGEPFFQDEMQECLDFFRNHCNPDIKIVIFTNLKTSKQKLQSYIDKFLQLIEDKKIGSLQITASLDCWGPEAEYIRTGLDLKQWEENFIYILNQKDITVTVNAAITNIGLKTLPDLIDKIIEWNKINPVYFWFMPVTTPSYLVPNIFGKYFSKDLNRSLVKFDQINYLNQKDYFVGIIKEIYSNKQNDKEIKKLLIFLDEMDRRRKTNWRQLFPWLEKDYGHLNQ